MKKWIALFLSLVIVLIAGCSSTQQTAAEPPKDGKKIVLRYATNATEASPEYPVVEKIFKKFQEDYPNVTIKVEVSPGYDLQTKMQMDATSNRLPDIFSYWRPDPAYGLDKMIDSGLVADLTEMTNDQKVKELFAPSEWDTASRNGKVYGIPYKMFYIHILANKDAFAKAGVQIPKTWEDWLAAMPSLKKAGVIPWGASLKGDHGVRLFDLVIARTLTNERAMNMFAGKEPINVPDMVKALDNLKKLVVGNIPEDAIAIDGDPMYAKYINTEKAALIIDGSFNINKVDAKLADKMEVIDFPLITGGAQKEKRVEKDLTSLIYASAESWKDKNKRTYIEELMKRMTNREASKEMTDLKVPMPTQGLTIDPKVIGRLAFETQELALKAQANRWLLKVMEAEKRKKFEPLLAGFLNGQFTPEQFAKQLDDLFIEKK
ncbi:ABC transporter substrate-binding protein [Paenibacillus periandrae]|uniref:ABC transporter substrate-binding protein n=1 Tax=Paenibacillus periandrae TaxID=1761741 RepID=UPI001F093723|nr:extracellular solute-binding protein [Paenibacillus periandrae]